MCIGVVDLEIRDRIPLRIWMMVISVGEGNGNPLQCSCLENPRDGVAQSWT